MKFRIPMWVAGRKRLLSEVLATFAVGGEWRLLWFDGVVADGSWRPPVDRELDLPLTDRDLRAFASTLLDLNDLVLVGAPGGVPLRLECRDSTTWELTTAPTHADTVASWLMPLRRTRGDQA